MIDYSAVYVRVDEFLQTREGLRNPKKPQDYPIFVQELTGIFCGAAYSNDLTTFDILEFLDLVQDHKIVGVVDNGKCSQVMDLISKDITDHVLYFITEFTLMKYKPASVQVGPGEFFFCFYDCDSVFGIDNQAGFDIITDNVATELKQIGSNLTTPELFDKYAKSDKVDRLLVVLPVSNAVKPTLRSRYTCISFDKMDWRDAFVHTGKAGSLSLK